MAASNRIFGILSGGLKSAGKAVDSHLRWGWYAGLGERHSAACFRWAIDRGTGIMAAESRHTLDHLLRTAGSEMSPSKPPQVSAAAGQTAVSSAVQPPSPVSAAPVDSIVRTRLEKHGGAIAPCDPSSLVSDPSSLVPVKSHLRSAPGAGTQEKAADKSKPAKLTVTLELLVSEFRRTSGRRPIGPCGSGTWSINGSALSRSRRSPACSLIGHRS